MSATSAPWRLRSAAYIGTVGTEIAVLLAKLGTYRLAATSFDDSTLGAYLVATQIVAVSQSAVVIGADVALTRALAMHPDSEGDRLASSALCTSLGAAAALAIGLLVFRNELADVLFDDGRRGAVVAAVAAMLFGAALHPVVAAWFRGRERFGAANALQVLVHVVVPVAAIVLSRGNLPLALAFIGIGWFGASSAFFAFDHPGRLSLRADGALVRFGLTRAGADFLQVAFFAVPVVLVPHVATLAHAGDVAFGVAVVTMIGSTFVPLGLVLLPRVARHASTASEEIEALVRRVVIAAAGIGALGTIAAWTAGGWVMQSFLERADGASVTYFRIISLAAAPYTIYVATRRIVDALSAKALNTSNLAIAVAAVVGTTALGAVRESAFVLCGGFVLAAWLLGALSLRTLLLLQRQSERNPLTVTP